MAEVYRAKSLGIAGFEKVVAIKRVLPRLAEDEDFVEMFIEEAKIAGQLQHASIAQIFELGKIDDVHFIAMEYVFGKNVRMVLDAQRKMGRQMPASLAAWIGAQVLAGLDYAHRKRDGTGRPLGIIHRDVSPPNVIVSYDGQVKLVDFGIAKAASRAVQTVAGVIKGKLAYMSPEQLRGHTLDHRSDVFAASALIHEMITGERLFDADSDFAVSELVRDAKAYPPSEKNPEVSMQLDAVIMRGLARERDARWSTAGEMQEALMQAVAKPGALLGAAALRSWMRTAFAADYQAEKATLERLAEVERAGVALVSDPPTTPDDFPSFDHSADFDDEATMVSMPPNPPPGMMQDIDIEVSALVMVGESFGQFEPAEIDEAAIVEDSQRDFHPSFASPRAADEASLHIRMPSLGESSFGAEPSAPIEVLNAAPPAGTSTTLPPTADVRPPSVRFETMPQSSPGLQPAAAEEEEEEGGISFVALFFVAILALLIGVGGVVAFLYFTGRPLPFQLPF